MPYTTVFDVINILGKLKKMSFILLLLIIYWQFIPQHEDLISDNDEDTENSSYHNYSYNLKYFEMLTGNDYLSTAFQMNNFFRTQVLPKETVIVIAYPKAGTYWLRNVITLMQINLNYSFFEMNNASYKRTIMEAQRLLNPNVHLIFHHETINIFAMNIERRYKVIYAMRNPKDTFASTYHYLKSMNEIDKNFSMEYFFDYYLVNHNKHYYATAFSDWWLHVKLHADLKDIHLIHYEDIIRTPLSTLKSLSRFLGKSHTLEELDKLNSYFSFENLKEQERKYGNSNVAVKNKNVNSSDDKSHYRKGKIGDWRNYLDKNRWSFVDYLTKNLLAKCKKCQFYYGKD